MSLDGTMLLEDVQMEVAQFLADIHNGTLHMWSDDMHAEVQQAATDLMQSMARLRENATAKPQREFVALEAAE